MKDEAEVWRRDEIESPCVKVCVMHTEAGICIGCHRTLQEIAGWSAMTHAARAAIMADLPGRGQALHRRRGGRRGWLARES
ncbi:MAG: DUF1289 domain-containing protein [Gemmobacter sp.]